MNLIWNLLFTAMILAEVLGGVRGIYLRLGMEVGLIYGSFFYFGGMMWNYELGGFSG